MFKNTFHITLEIPESICEEDCNQDEAYIRIQLLQYGKMKYFYIIRFKDELAVDMCLGGGGVQLYNTVTVLGLFNTRPNVSYGNISH
jgi:hypothetical protein